MSTGELKGPGGKSRKVRIRASSQGGEGSAKFLPVRHKRPGRHKTRKKIRRMLTSVLKIQKRNKG